MSLPLTLVCVDVMLAACMPRGGFWVFWGTPFRGERYGRGDDESVAKETGDGLEC